MKLSKQFPLNALRVFEAVARLGSFTRAGDELGMTQTAVSYQIILTKADKLRSQRDIDQVTAETLRKIAKRPAAFPRVLATSAEKGAGIPELRAEILAACET